MGQIIKSKAIAWSAMVLTILLIVLAFISHSPWWGFIAIFFLFLGVFAHIVSLYFYNFNRTVGRKLDVCAFVCIILAVLGFIAEYVIFNVKFDL